MKSKPWILPLCLTFSLIGIFILLLISGNIQSKQIYIKEINNKLLNKQVMIQGNILNIKSFEDSNFQIILVQDSTGKIDVTLDKILKLSKNQSLIIIGKITEYDGELQIQANKIISS